MQTFLAQRDFSAKAGEPADRVLVQVKKDTVFRFDGTTVELAGVQYRLPCFRSAVRAGWLVRCGEGAPAPKPAPTSQWCGLCGAFWDACQCRVP